MIILLKLLKTKYKKTFSIWVMGWKSKYKEGSCHDLIWGTIPDFDAQTGKKSRKSLVHFRDHYSQSLAPILSQLNPAHTLQFHFFRIHFNSILPCLPGSLKWSPSFRISGQNFVYIGLLFHPSWCHHLNYIWRGVQTAVAYRPVSRQRPYRKHRSSVAVPLLHSRLLGFPLDSYSATA
jgi:hypothetical protein